MSNMATLQGISQNTYFCLVFIHIKNKSFHHFCKILSYQSDTSKCVFMRLGQGNKRHLVACHRRDISARDRFQIVKQKYDKWCKEYKKYGVWLVIFIVYRQNWNFTKLCVSCHNNKYMRCTQEYGVEPKVYETIQPSCTVMAQNL